ncbi:MAG TPA: lipid-transfer protein [Steroidobacteraceae bacterium]|nr:lipid-transfer protein [Steroidobacteraceae bacterium]HQX46270.1 lipid-transfer protein [Steroidobacteraceae bacterium]HQX78852.1 lipid-transfer protein [Steroidobacteraceae bacterium]HQZ80707.1 lipid-transfer protein [Steroidobacteraceae bacterium]
MTHPLKDQAAIVGIGATEFSKDSGRSELQLAVEAIKAALDDAGLATGDVDGLSTFTMDNNPEIEVFRNLGGKELRFFSRIDYGGGGACAPVHQAAMAVHSGVADVVVCYRAMNERSQYRFGASYVPPPLPSAALATFGWTVPFGLATPASWVAMAARRYMHDFGATTEDFGRVAVAGRRMAANNPKAWFHQKPITLADHQASRWIVEPLRLLDCCQESDGAVAIVVTRADRARHLQQKPVLIRGAAQGACDDQMNMTSFYRKDISALSEMRLVAKQLYAMSGLGPNDIQTAVLYDHFSPFVLPQLEAFDFCKRGEAKDFIKDGNLDRGGRLPVNTHGGQLGEAYIHGVNGIAEGVRQVRGSSVNQVKGVEHVLVTAGTGVPTSGLILAAA